MKDIREEPRRPTEEHPPMGENVPGRELAIYAAGRKLALAIRRRREEGGKA